MYKQVDGFDVRINIDQMPEHEFRYFARETLAACKRFYADPKNRAALEKWQAERDAKKKGEGRE